MLIEKCVKDCHMAKVTRKRKTLLLQTHALKESNCRTKEKVIVLLM